MWEKLAHIILRNRIVLVVSIFIITGIMGFMAKDLRPTYKFKPPVSKTDSAVVEFEKFQKYFKSEAQVFVLALEDVKIKEYKNYNKWVDLINKVRTIEGVETILSFDNFVQLEYDTANNVFTTNESYNNYPSIHNQNDLNNYFDNLKNFPIYNGVLFVDSSDVFVSAISLNTEIMNTAKREVLVADIVKKIDEFQEKTGIHIKKSGLPYIRVTNAVKIKSEIGFFIGLAMLVVGFILFLFFRSLTATFFSLLVVSIGVIWSLGTMAILNFPITILTSMIPPLIIVIGVPNCVFLLNKYHYEFQNHGNKLLALKRVIIKVGNASFMTNLTTALGFGTFILTGSNMLIEFGIVAFLNIILVFFISLIIIPSFYTGLKPPKAKHLRHLKRNWMNYIIQWMIEIVQTRRRSIYLSAAAVCIFGVIGIMQIKTSGTITDDVSKDDPMYLDMKFIESKLKGVLPMDITIDTKRKNGVLKTSNLKRINKFQQHLETYPDISKSNSVVDLLKYGRQAFFQGDVFYYDLPTKTEKNWILSAIKKTGNQLENSEDEKASAINLNSVVDSNLQIARVSMFIKDVGSKRMDKMKEQINQELDKTFPPNKYETSITGSSVLYYKGTKYLVDNLYQSLGLAIIIISFIMAILFQSWRMVIVSLLPNLLPLILTAGLMGYLGIVIKPSTILVFSIAFGISVDDTIHFLAKYRQELKNNKRGTLKPAILAAIRETGVSMIYTSIILFFGFSIFMASDFGGTVALGMLVSIALLVAMVSNLILLPTMLMSLDLSQIKKSIYDPLVESIDEEDDIELESLKIEKKN
jgi:predicted RND superfamily exporter protein